MTYPYRLLNNKKISCSYECDAIYRMKLANTDKISKFIDLVKTNEFAYLVGFICTDGHISLFNYKGTIKSQVNIALSIIDKDILKDITDFFGGSYHDYPTAKIPTAQWRTSYKPFINYLVNEINIIKGNKTFKIDVSKWFKQLNIEQKCSFLRGVIDGDGSISVRSSKKYQPCASVSIVSCSLKFINLIKRFLKEQNIEYHINMGIKENYYYIMITKSKDALQFLDMIYNVNCDLKMKRKYDKYKLLKGCL